MHSALVLKLLRCSPFGVSTLEAKEQEKARVTEVVADTQRFVTEEIEKMLKSMLYLLMLKSMLYLLMLKR
jgi:hypothetical protein